MKLSGSKAKRVRVFLKLHSLLYHQVLGLTASMGVGKASTAYEAEYHIMKMCANLDAEEICTVQDPRNKEELRQIRDNPEEGTSSSS